MRVLLLQHKWKMSGPRVTERQFRGNLSLQKNNTLWNELTEEVFAGELAVLLYII